ncbi:hypothetical protein RND81_02G150800 [Saponaria officinalis]|uniref:C3H1-type domain-containing protein n=1 Tax=Saponaria officinalis TaxID=3572 RepID=A0AAW1MLQ4_SAPOF
MATVNKQPPHSSSSLSKDDLWKRSTDCVYFLASPLTCKKGSECEYRHSETTRNNPRDCWYWLSGTCSLSANCTYRHPPLDVLVPPQAENYPGPPVGQPFTSIPQNAGKQRVPCYRCPYLHGLIPQPNSKVQPVQPTTSVTETSTFKKTFGVPEKDAQSKMNFHTNSNKFIRNAVAVVEKPSPRGVIEEATNFRETAVHVAGNGSFDNESFRSGAALSHHANLVDDQYYQNGREVDDSLRESSPGFDVLVEDKLKEDEYYHDHDEDQYVRVRGHEGRRSSEFDSGRHGDYTTVAYVDYDAYHSKRKYDAYEGMGDKYAQGHRGASSERLSAHDRRGLYKLESTDFKQNSSYLRHRLSKQPRGMGLRSVVRYRSTRMDTRRSPTRDNPVSSRLQGRIKLPRRSPSNRNTYLERDNERGRNLGSLSPSRPRLSSLQGRLRDRLGARIQEESFEGRSVRGRDNGDAFSSSKRFSELRGNKHDNKNQQLTGQQSVSGGKLRDTVLGSSLRNEGDISFDGPKPLSEILKRKRNAASTASTGVVNYDNKEVENGVHLTSITTNFSTDTEKPVAVSSEPEQIQSSVQVNNESVIADADDEDEAKISNKKVKLVEDEPSLPDEQKHPEAEEEGLVGAVEEEAEVEEGFDHGDGEEAEVDEEFDQGDGEYDYEHDDVVEGYHLNEGDVANNEGFMDEEDGDDFAKKLGVSF